MSDVVIPAPRELFRDPAVWKAAVYFPASGVLGLGWLIVLAAGVPLAAATTIIWVGLLVWVALLLLLRGGSILDRRLIGLVFGTEIPSPYRKAPSGGMLQRAAAILGDPATWKDLAFQIVRIPLSFGYFVGSAAAWGTVVGLIISPISAPYNESFVPDIVPFRENVDTVYEAIPLAIIGLLAVPVLLYAIKGASIVHVFVARALLGPSEKQLLRTRAMELQASRARGVDAAESERRRIERDLHDGAQQQLLAVAMDIGRARSKLDADPEAARRLIDQAHTGARAAITELRQLARGIYPAILTDRGLDAALSALAARSSVPVRISVHLEDRPPAAVESIAYFTVAEALTNIDKYAQASQAVVEVTRDQDQVVVEVRDNGIGGARIHPGGGLAGLADRAATIDGTLSLSSPPGGPTLVRATLPCTWLRMPRTQPGTPIASGWWGGAAVPAGGAVLRSGCWGRGAPGGRGAGGGVLREVGVLGEGCSGRSGVGSRVAGEGGSVRVVIAEDSVLLREGLVRLLADEGVETVGTASEGEGLVELVAGRQPDLAIVDVRMPPTFTDEGLRAALAVRPTPVLVLSQYVEEQYAAELLGGGARGVGYLLKERVSEVGEFIDAVRRVAAGGTVIDPEVIAQLLGRNPLADLTPREREVLALMAEGLSNAGLARRLVIGEGAVEKHISRIFLKLGLDSSQDAHRRVQAVLAYLRGRE